MAQVGALLLHRIEKNPGLLPVKEGQALVSHDAWTLIKILDLKLLYEELESNIGNYIKLKNHVQNYFNTTTLDTDLIEVETQADYAMNITIEKFKQLNPSVRSKRGLLNPLGSLIKTITGNLDNDDAIKYETLIQEVKSKQNVMNNKMTIVTEMLGSFTKIANSTKSNFINIQESIQDINRSLNESKWTQSANRVIHIYNAFINNFQTIYLRLNEIETAVAFARVKQLHQSIIDTDELILLLRKIEKTDKLIFPVNIENIARIEQCIEIKAYVKQNQIKLIMRIPLIRNEIFNYFKLIPLPMYNTVNDLTSVIIPKYPYVLVKGLKALPLAQPCVEIDEARFLCFENNIPPQIEDNCITDLMKFSPNITTCHPVPVTIDNVKADLIQPNQWIIYAKMETLLTKFCNDEITQDTISGTYLLAIDDDCEVNIEDLKLKQRQSQGQIMFIKFPVIQLPAIRVNETATLQKPVNLNGVDLADTQFLNLLLQKSGSDSVSENKYSAEKYKSIGVGNVVFYVITSMCIVLLAFKSRIKEICNNIISQTRDHPHPSDNPDLTEGGVIHPTPALRPMFLSA